MFTYLIRTNIKAKSTTGSYLRQAYGVGQEQQAKLGANPFKYGIEGETDFHSGISSTEASNYPGSHGNQDNDPKTVITATTSVRGEPPSALSSAGLTGVGPRRILANPSSPHSNAKRPSVHPALASRLACSPAGIIPKK